jgi:hypothetical protein
VAGSEEEQRGTTARLALAGAVVGASGGALLLGLGGLCYDPKLAQIGAVFGFNAGLAVSALSSLESFARGYLPTILRDALVSAFVLIFALLVILGAVAETTFVLEFWRSGDLLAAQARAWEEFWNGLLHGEGRFVFVVALPLTPVVLVRLRFRRLLVQLPLIAGAGGVLTFMAAAALLPRWPGDGLAPVMAAPPVLALLLALAQRLEHALARRLA